MAISILTSDLEVGPKLVDTVITETAKSSAFLSASQKLPLTADGLVIPYLSSTMANFVGEGAAKPVINPSLSDLEIRPFKIAKIATVSSEFVTDRSVIWNAVKADAVASIARRIDATIAGVQAGPSGFDTLGASPTATVTNWTTWVAAKRAHGANRNSAIVLNQELLSDLEGVPNATNTGPLLNITDGTIGGLPYFLGDFGTNNPLGFVGPFATSAYWGVIPGSVTVKLSTEATVDGVELFTQNQVAVLVEGRFGFRTVDSIEGATTQSFRKLATENGGGDDEEDGS